MAGGILIDMLFVYLRLTNFFINEPRVQYG